MPGFGTYPYGLGAYGTGAAAVPGYTAVSTSGTTLRVYFTHAMTNNAALTDVVNYLIGSTAGISLTFASVSVAETNVDGVTAVDIVHSGSTLGGKYILRILNVQTHTGILFDLATPTSTFYTLGTDFNYVPSAPSGTEVLLTFDHDLLPEVDYTPGIETLSSYLVDFATGVTYPVPLTLTGVTNPTPSTILFDVTGMTSLDYEFTISPADAIIYDGSALPSASSTFTGTESGTGVSSSVSGNLVLSKLLGDTYSWSFLDTSGKITGTSNYRLDLYLELTSANILPPITTTTDVVATLTVSNGAIQVELNLNQSGGVDQIQFLSGASNITAQLDWSTGYNKISLIRNEKAGLYSVLWNDFPIITDVVANVTEPAVILAGGAGAIFQLNPSFQVASCKIDYFNFRSSDTVFSSTWNFLHSVAQTFTGNPASAKDFFYTEKGPLVKGWGDATPATDQDVTVYVNSTPVSVSDVNPYTGKITLTTPIPLSTPGTVSVEVDYKWFENPVFEIPSLNTEGLVLNLWDRASGHDAPSNAGAQVQDASNPKGAVGLNRFPMSIVLGPVIRQKPILYGYQYLGFDRGLTATLNNPMSLLLNQNPHSVKVEDFRLTPTGVSGSFDGTQPPHLSDPYWDLVGVDSGMLQTGLGTYQLIDSSSGSFDVGTSAYYYRELDQSFPATTYMAVRFEISDYTLDGVFTGVSFGVHDNRRLYCIGALLVNDVQHMGVLVNPGRPHEIESWEVAGGVDIAITSSTTLVATTADLPTNIVSGQRFQILSGTQAGVYTIDSLVAQSDGTTIITTTTAFPDNYKLWGNRDKTIHFELLWEDVPATYRIVLDVDQHAFQLYVGTRISGKILEMDESETPQFAIPANSTLQLTTADKGQLFWGSISRKATNTSVWSFVNYGVVPDQTMTSSHGHVVSSEMGEVPENDPNSEWFITQDFGYSEVDSTGQNLLLKSTSGSEVWDQTFGYSRVETILGVAAHCDIDVAFKVESGVRGAGDAQVVLNDTRKEARLGTLLFLDGQSPTHRILIDLPTQSLSGLYLPVSDGWTSSGTNTITQNVFGHVFESTQALTQLGHFTKNLDTGGALFADQGLRIIESRFAVKSYTANASGYIGVFFGGEVGDDTRTNGGDPRRVSLILIAPVGANPAKVALVDMPSTLDSVAIIQEYEFDWTDGLFHDYRIIANEVADSVSLTIDDTVRVPGLTLGAFPAADTNTLAFFGHFGTDVVSHVEWDSLSYSFDAPTTAKRTLGVLLDPSNPDDINSWEIPRTDATTAPNSSASAVVEEMDWRSRMEIRIHKDREWGITVFRPDLAPPPYYTGAFATQITEPSAGWINVEYDSLPATEQLFGSVSWGALNQNSVTQQRWDYVRYRIYKHWNEEFSSPQHMVLNQFHVISSPDLLGDVTPETIAVTTFSKFALTLIPTQIFASRIFNVVDGATVFTPDQFRFDPDTQTLFLNLGYEFSSENASVTITFAAGKPVTETYLKAQPFADIGIHLNEVTPPFEYGFLGDPISSVAFGSQINDWRDNLNVDPDFILNDPYRYVEFQNDESALYECMQFYSRNDGQTRGLLVPFTDHAAPNHGLAEVALEGNQYTELLFNGILDHPHEYPGVLYYSGGSFPALGGVLGPVVGSATPIMWSNQGSGGTSPGILVMGVNQQVKMIARNSVTGAIVWQDDF